MVGEFPELQGLMGGYYARAEGLPDAVADAIRDHYKPVGQGDDVPTAPATVAVAFADKLDTLAAFFAINEKPTGSRDPFALRRAALGIISIIQANELRLSVSMQLAAALATLVGKSSASADRFSFEVGVQQLEAAGVQFSEETVDRLRDVALQNALDRASPIYDQIIQPSIVSIILFLADRLKVQQREAGVRHDLIDAVFALGGEDDLVRLLARVKALQAFMATEDGTNLLAGYKRAANILKQAGQDVSSNSRHAELVSASTAGPWTLKQVQGDERLGAADAALFEALDGAEPAASAAVAEERFTDAMAALASLRAPIDAFFDGVMVNDPDEAVRAYRLGLLSRFTGAVHGVADFSKIEG
jgi:glycyl-tRNA synthetase beta chain